MARMRTLQLRSLRLPLRVLRASPPYCMYPFSAGSPHSRPGSCYTGGPLNGGGCCLDREGLALSFLSGASNCTAVFCSAGVTPHYPPAPHAHLPTPTLCRGHPVPITITLGMAPSPCGFHAPEVTSNLPPSIFALSVVQCDRRAFEVLLPTHSIPAPSTPYCMQVAMRVFAARSTSF